MAKCIKYGKGTMKVSCVVLLCSLFILSLSSIALAQTGCLSRQFDPQGGFKCNDIATGASQSSAEFNQNSNDENSDALKSGTSDYFNNRNYFDNRSYFDNRAYYEYNSKTSTKNDTEQQSGGTRTNQSFGTRQFDRNSKGTR